MKICKPLTLKLQYIIILCSVFVASQTITLIIFEHNRDNVILATEATDLADRVIGIVQLAYSFPEQDRQQILAAAETQFLALFPEIVSTKEVACQNNNFSKQLSARISESFTRLEGINADVCVRSFGDMPLKSRRTTLRQGFDVLITIHFADGKKSTFHAVLPEAKSLLHDSVLIYLLLAGGVALLLALYLIRKTIAPIERLAEAADQLGVNINNPPMDESGSIEVSKAARAFNSMQDRVVNLLHSQTEMLAAISHDLRSSVTRLQLRAELLKDEQEREGMLKVVTDMRQMTQSVLDFLRGQNSDEPMRKVNISALVESLCEDLIDEGFPVSYRTCEEPVNMMCRPTDIRRGLQNVIDNAVKYGGSAEINVIRAEGNLIISVEDKGQGIPEEHLQSVLQPFYRMEKSRNPETGSIGLGLTITLNIVNAHRGDFTLSNSLQGGVVAKMVFPL